ncbi:MAG: TetR/AcrR family transcriptional regulator [Meiothermus ruber]|jgi:AcrR family transcriptional regulator|uniref:TetR/AcrR family transcriptional regulator n=1 Tax=Meiothermus ruber TaxID=277 RepID=UPI00391C01E2
MTGHHKKRQKRPHGEATREKLIEATVRILSQEGLGAVSTARLAREVGIVQSGFYAHFDSLEACISVAAERIGERIRASLAEGLELLGSQGPGDYHLVKAQYHRLLTELQQQWVFVELLIRYFRDPSPLGRALSRVQQGLRSDLVSYLTRVVEPLNWPKGGRPQAGFMADLLVSMTLSAVESLRWEPDLDRELVAHLLALQTLNTGKHLVEWMMTNKPPLSFEGGM